jgi:hypothetical protein
MASSIVYQGKSCGLDSQHVLALVRILALSSFNALAISYGRSHCLKRIQVEFLIPLAVLQHCQWHPGLCSKEVPESELLLLRSNSQILQTDLSESDSDRETTSRDRLGP